MTACNRGDVVLVGFVFSDESGKKLRPAVVVSSQDYHRARQEVVVAAITSNVRRRLFGDHLIADWKGAGLLFAEILVAADPSMMRGTTRRGWLGGRIERGRGHRHVAIVVVALLGGGRLGGDGLGGLLDDRHRDARGDVVDALLPQPLLEEAKSPLISFPILTAPEATRVNASVMVDHHTSQTSGRSGVYSQKIPVLIAFARCRPRLGWAAWIRTRVSRIRAGRAARELPRGAGAPRRRGHLSNEEVAAVLGASVASVKSRLHRARMALREQITRSLTSR